MSWSITPKLSMFGKSSAVRPAFACSSWAPFGPITCRPAMNTGSPDFVGTQPWQAHSTSSDRSAARCALIARVQSIPDFGGQAGRAETFVGTWALCLDSHRRGSSSRIAFGPRMSPDST